MKRNFYTQNGWQGSNYDPALSTKDIAAKFKEYAKTQKAFKDCKFSIRTKFNEITIALMEAPFNAMLDASQTHTQNATHERVATPEAIAVMELVKSFISSYNYDDSDGMIDYFDRNFYDWYHIGKWDKPFKKIEPRATHTQERTSAHADGITFVDYSEKAFAITGDTRAIKDTLKRLGGRFNARLSCGAGWIFSKKNESAVKSALGI